MNRWRRALLCLVLTLTLAGCWNRREVNEVALVSAVALDREPDGRFRLTVQAIKPSALGGEAKGGGGQTQAVVRLAATGTTLFEAVRRLSHLVPREPEWQHNNAIIISADVARAGVSDLLDFFVRDSEARLDQWILVSRGRAEAMLAAQFPLEPNSGLAMRRLIRYSASFSAETVPVRLYDFLLALSSPTTAPLAPIIEPIRPDEGRTDGLPPAASMRIGGAAVFKRDRLVGWLSDHELHGLQWLRGRVVSAVVQVPCASGPGAGIGLKVLGSSSRQVAEWQQGTFPQVRVQIRVTAKLEDLMCQEDLSKPAAFARLEQRAGSVVAADAQRTLRKLQGQLGADPLGVGEALHRAYPRQWKDWQRRWDAVYPSIRVIPEVTVELKETGLSVGKPLPRVKPGSTGG